MKCIYYCPVRNTCGSGERESEICEGVTCKVKRAKK